MSMSGQKTVTASGTAEALGSGLVRGPLMVKALAANTHLVYVGGSDVDSTNGLELDAGEVVVFAKVGNLSAIYIDAVTNGEGVSWCVLNT